MLLVIYPCCNAVNAFENVQFMNENVQIVDAWPMKF